jgi:hypothetical protein
MQGWKTKTGAIIFAIGGALLAASQVVPDFPSPFWANMCKFVGTILSAGGGSLAGVGIAHKIEKAAK